MTQVRSVESPLGGDLDEDEVGSGWSCCAGDADSERRSGMVASEWSTTRQQLHSSGPPSLPDRTGDAMTVGKKFMPGIVFQASRGICAERAPVLPRGWRWRSRSRAHPAWPKNGRLCPLQRAGQKWKQRPQMSPHLFLATSIAILLMLFTDAASAQCAPDDTRCGMDTQLKYPRDIKL